MPEVGENKYFNELKNTSMQLFQSKGGKRTIIVNITQVHKHKIHELLKVHCEIDILHPFMKTITFCAGLKLC